MRPDKVVMIHDKVTGEIRVYPSAVPVLERSGWRLKDKPEKRGSRPAEKKEG